MGDTPEVRSAEVPTKPTFGELTKRTAAVGEFQATTLQWIVRFTLGALKEMRDDAQIALGLALVKAPIYGAISRVRFECESPAVKAFIEEEFQRLWRGAVRSSLSAVEFGFAAHEKLWSQDADGVHLDQIKDLDPMWSVLLHDEDGDFAGIRWTPMPSFAIGTAFIQPVTVPIALRAGQIDGQSQAQGVHIPLSDLLIGASALELGYAVGTANVRHFQLIPGLKVIQL